MFNRTKNLVPEPYLSGALWLIYWSMLYMRNYSSQISAEELSDLNDALHNVPTSIQENGNDFDEAKIREMYLRAYDAKWSQKENGICLAKILDAGMQRARDLGLSS